MPSGHNTVKVVDIPGGDSNEIQRRPNISYRRLAFSHDNQLLGFTQDETSIAIYDFRTQSFDAVPCPSDVEAIAFSSDGNFLTAASLEEINIYGGRHWEELQTIPQLRANAVAFSPDGRRIAVAHAHNIMLLDIEHDCARIASVSSAIAALGRPLGMPMTRWLYWTVLGRMARCASVSVGFWPKQMEFSHDGSQLLTEHGALCVPAGDDGMAAPAGPPVLFGIGREWISCMGRNILWVPPQCRLPHRRAILAHGFAWADDVGIGRHIEFDPSLMSDLGDWPPAETLPYEWSSPGRRAA
jgi:hypothetical protein